MNYFYEGDWDDDRVQRIIEATDSWAMTHPKKSEAFLVLMGRSLTPLEFLDEVREGTRFGRSFVGFLFDQAQRYEEEPEHFIYRAASSPDLDPDFRP
jgi:hypothetical protein